jgi:hypothetical protein
VIGASERVNESCGEAFEARMDASVSEGRQRPSGEEQQARDGGSVNERHGLILG